MRIDRTLDTASFAEAELSALRLDGDGFALGLAVVVADVPVDAAVRAASLHGELQRYGLVADSWTAAWVHGVWPVLPNPLTLAVDVRDGRRTRTLRPAPREVRFAPGDVEVLGGVRVASAFKTAFDLTRLAEDFDGAVARVSRALLEVAGLDGGAASAAAERAPGCPNKTRAILRFAALSRR